VDTGYDYITPEFLNLIFFQQNSVVIFPYLDLKHLHSLEIFAIGYNIVDIDATAIHNIIELLEHESYNSYSQNPTVFFISNIARDQLQKIITLGSVHCVINLNENIDNLPRESNNFVFYNKKSKKFLNFDVENIDLSFETWLIKSSQNLSILHDKILKIKSIATRLFTEINENADIKKLIEILSEYEEKYWDKIIQFTENFYEIKFPKLPRVRISSQSTEEESLNEFSKEYETIIKSNQNISVEFVRALDEYRIQRVNPANLELMELYNPRKLYCYLRTHHWEQGIPEEFIQDWVSMKSSHYPLSESDRQDFLSLFSKLDLPYANIKFPTNDKEQLIPSLDDNNENIRNEKPKINVEVTTTIPSVQDFPLFKQWIFKKLDKIELRLKSLKN